MNNPLSAKIVDNLTYQRPDTSDDFSIENFKKDYIRVNMADRFCLIRKDEFKKICKKFITPPPR